MRINRFNDLEWNHHNCAVERKRANFESFSSDSSEHKRLTKQNNIENDPIEDRDTIIVHYLFTFIFLTLLFNLFCYILTNQDCIKLNFLSSLPDFSTQSAG